MRIIIIQRARRRWIIDRRFRYLNERHRLDLGDWIERRKTKGVIKQADDARVLVKESGMSEVELLKEWDLQKSAQLSVRQRKSHLFGFQSS